MKDLASKLDDLLALVPFNGDKTALSAGLKLLLPVLTAQFPILALVSPFLDAASTVFLGIGMFHKLVKSVNK